MKINGADLVTDLSGALYWPAQGLLMVADLHLEKGSAFAARGRLLPPYDTRATLERLAAAIARHRPQAVACLGDSFHDRQAGQRIHGEDVETIRALARGRDWIWIAGNHDPEPPAGLPGRLLPELRLDGLTLRHEPVAGHAAGEVAGHLHPKAAVVVQGRRMARRCFVSDGLRAVLPAFGAYAGGLDVLDRAFRPVFPHAFHAHLLGRGAVHAVPSRRLTPIA